MIARFKAAFALVFCLLALGAVQAQDDVGEITGDIPAGPPFDGSVGRVSMFDLQKIASLSYDAFAGQENTADDIKTLVEAALAEKGYGGTRITVTTDFDAADRSCASGDLVETRVRYSPALDAVEVVVAAEIWVAALAYDPKQSDQMIETPTQNCVVS